MGAHVCVCVCNTQDGESQQVSDYEEADKPD